MKHTYANILWVQLIQGTCFAKNSILFFGVLFFMFFSSLGVVGQNGVSITSTSTNPTTQNPIPIVIKFDQPVNFFEQSEISLVNGSLSDYFVKTPKYIYSENLTRLGSFRINVLSSDLSPIKDAIVALDIDSFGNIYALTFNNGIKKFNSNGVAVSNNPIITKDKFTEPRDIAIDADGNIYVADSGNNRIVVFNNLGTKINTIGGSQLKKPSGLAINSDQNIYVADTNNDRIVIFNKTGGFIGEINNGSGNGSNQLNDPLRLAVDKFDNVYVNDLGNDRIQIYNKNFEHTGTIPAGPQTFGAAGSIVVDEYGFIYIADLGSIDLNTFLNLGDLDISDLIPLATETNLSVKVFRSDNLNNPPTTIKDKINIPVDLAFKPCGYLAINNGDAKPEGGFFVKVTFDLKTYKILPDTFTANLTIAEECVPAKLNIPSAVAVNIQCVDNTASTNFETIWDKTKPTKVFCPLDQTRQLTNGNYILEDFRSLPIFSDNCDDDLTPTQDPPKDTSITVTTTVTIIATDAAGNISEACTFKVIIEEENEAPIAINDNYSTNQDTPLTVNAPGVLSNDNDADNDPLTAIIQNPTTNGTLTLNSDGSFTYTPNSGYFGDDTFTYVANDGTDNSNVATVTITVNKVVPSNTAPIASNDNYSTNQDTPLTVNAPGVLSNDNDADNDPLTAVIQNPTTNGTLTLNSDGSFTYTPNSGYFGDDTFTYVANDGTDNSNVATVTITVNKVVPSNTAPIASNDNYGTNQDTPLTVNAPGVLSNDSDADGDSLTAIIQGQPTNGTLTLNLDGSFTYIPNPGYFGDDTFTYVANDGNVNSNVATVTITVNKVVPSNTAPIASNDNYSTNQDTPLTVSAPGVLSNDNDADNDPLTAIIQNPTTNGTLTLNSDGSFTYTPNSGYFGDDSFSYVANDGTDNSNVATVTITVNKVVPSNTAPIASNDNYSTNQDTPLTVNAPGVLSNDNDADNDHLTAVIQNPTTNGTLTLNSDGSFTYTPNPGYFGDDTFTYVANDGTDNSNVATVTITVNKVVPSNTAPIASNDNYSTNQDTPLTVNAPGVLSNDNDADNDPLTAVVQSQPTDGTLTLNPDGSFTYTPNSGYFGDDSFTYVANDGTANSNISTVTITVNPEGNTRPESRNDTYSTLQNNTLDVPKETGVLNNDSDADDNPLTAILSNDVSNGQLTLNPDGSFSYTPNNNFFGTDSFTYFANDGTVNSEVATVEIEVVEVTDNTVVCKEEITLELDETGRVALDVRDLFVSRPANLQFSVDQEFFTCDDLGENTIILSYSNAEIQGSCEVKVLVKDVSPPTINVLNINIGLNQFGAANITPQNLDNGTTDNCGEVQLSLSKTNFSCRNLGINEVIFTATDPSGNSSSTTVTVIISGNCEIKPDRDIDHIFIYPNPSSGPFQFATPPGVLIYRVEVFDARGRFLMFDQYSETELLEYALDLSEYQSAVYLLKLYTSRGIVTIRAIIN